MSIGARLRGFLPGEHSRARMGTESPDHAMDGWGPVGFRNMQFGYTAEPDVPTRQLPSAYNANDRSKRAPQLHNGAPDLPSSNFAGPYAMSFLRSNQFNLKAQNQRVGGSVPIAVGPIQIQQLRAMTYQNLPRYGVGPGMLFPAVNPRDL